MSFDISQSEWANTPQSVKNYINELHTTIKHLQAELNKYLQFAEGENDPAETLCFNGLTDFLATPYPLDINPEAFSFESRFFVNGNRAGEFKIIHMYGPEMVHKTNWVALGKGRNIGWLSWQHAGIWWGLFASNGIATAIHSGHAKQGDVNPPMWYMEGENSIAVNAWHHVCGTYDSRELKLYIDGKLVNKTPFQQKIKLATQAYIGAHYGGTSQFFPGMLDRVRIWNKALESEEVMLHHIGGIIEDDTLVINYSAKAKPVFVGGGQDWEPLIYMEKSLNIENLPPAQKSLIEDLKAHLADLEKRKKGI